MVPAWCGSKVVGGKTKQQEMEQTTTKVQEHMARNLQLLRE
jgi:hypothetical protein